MLLSSQRDKRVILTNGVFTLFLDAQLFNLIINLIIELIYKAPCESGELFCNLYFECLFYTVGSGYFKTFKHFGIGVGSYFNA